MAWMLLVIVQIITVVERNLFPCPDFTNGHHPNAAFFQQRLAIRLATVIQKSRRIPAYVAVEVLLVIQRENVVVVALTTLKRLAIRDFLTNILNNTLGGRMIQL